LKIGLEVPLWFIMAVWLNAPVFEEAIKMLPMVLPVPPRFLQDASQALWAGLALGLGFGLGEAAYLAYGIAQSPAYSQFPWYTFTGFAVERMIVTFAHGLMTSIAVAGFHYGRRNMLFGYLTAVGLHALINLGPILLALKLIPPTVSSMGSYVAILAAFVIFQKNERTARNMNGAAPREIIYFER
jgi:RsiW-degrading membrane proteinase PrsW (M82 family)